MILTKTRTYRYRASNPRG